MSPEFFVVAASLVLAFFLVLLTVITQLQVSVAATRPSTPWTAAPLSALYSCVSRSTNVERLRSSERWENGSGNGRPPGRKARRTERRRQRHPLVKYLRSHPRDQICLKLLCMCMCSSLLSMNSISTLNTCQHMVVARARLCAPTMTLPVLLGDLELYRSATTTNYLSTLSQFRWCTEW